jgi:polo-like kinase 1
MIEKMSSDESKDLIYIKKWLVTDHAIIFRMSNKVVQVCFLDKSELVLCSESKIVTYVDRSGISSVYPLSTAMETQNREMAKRLRYTKEILTSMLNPGTGGTGDYRPGRTEG